MILHLRLKHLTLLDRCLRFFTRASFSFCPDFVLTISICQAACRLTPHTGEVFLLEYPVLGRWSSAIPAHGLYLKLIGDPSYLILLSYKLFSYGGSRRQPIHLPRLIDVCSTTIKDASFAQYFEVHIMKCDLVHYAKLCLRRLYVADSCNRASMPLHFQ